MLKQSFMTAASRLLLSSGFKKHDQYPDNNFGNIIMIQCVIQLVTDREDATIVDVYVVQCNKCSIPMVLQVLEILHSAIYIAGLGHESGYNAGYKNNK